MDKPLVSVLIPVRNEALHIEACLASVMTCEPGPMARGIEVVVVDDHSSDETAAIVALLAASAPRWPVRFTSNPGRGTAAALNHAYVVAKGEVLVLLGGDDLVVPHNFPARVTPLLTKAPAVLACRYLTMSDDPRLDGVLMPRRIQADHISGGATSFNRAFAERYFPIPPQLPNEDTWLRAVILRDAIPVLRIGSVGLRYRLHEGNSTGQNRSFSQVDKALARRHAAYRLALETQGGQSSAGRARLTALVRAEALRAAGRWYAIPFVRGLSRGDMVTCIANSRLWLYNFKTQAVRRRLRARR